MNQTSEDEPIAAMSAEVARAFTTLRRDHAVQRDAVLDRALRIAAHDADRPIVAAPFPLARVVWGTAAFAAVVAVTVAVYVLANTGPRGSVPADSLRAHAPASAPIAPTAAGPRDAWLERTLATAPAGATIRVNDDVDSGPIRFSKPVRLVAGDRGVRIGLKKFDEAQPGSAG